MTSLPLRVFLIVLIALLLVFGTVCLYLSHRQQGARLHYFLYDRRRKQKIPRDELTFEMVDEGVHHYLADYVSDPIELWRGIPKKLAIQLQGDPQFRPLIGFLMLLELSHEGGDAALATFEQASEGTVAYLCLAVRDGGDREMADYIFRMKKSISRERARIPQFFSKNRRCFEERMLRFVERHMSDFYMDKARVEN